MSLIEDDQRTDQELIEAANGGESSAFELLYFRHRDWAVNLAFRFTADRELALDVLQDAFVYFARKFPGFTLTCELRTFLYPVIKNRSLNVRMKAKRYESGEDLFPFLQAPATKEEASNEGLLAVLSTLPEHHQEVLLLRFVDGMALSEIASALDLPLGTVKSRLHNALTNLREDPRTKDLLT